MTLTIIYLSDAMLISKKEYSSWREVQDEYDDYKASLGPWCVEDVIQFMNEEYGTLQPSVETQISALVSGSRETISLDFS